MDRMGCFTASCKSTLACGYPLIVRSWGATRVLVSWSRWGRLNEGPIQRMTLTARGEKVVRIDITMLDVAKNMENFPEQISWLS